MTPKEKAKELIEKFMYDAMLFVTNVRNRANCAKVCALIVVDEIIGIYHIGNVIENAEKYCYWMEVKKEISNL